ncbi:hypothetical protein [Flavobacterium bizetiae]|uniref:hypothetical protein n=1 Tax=Flavobacterium bizetiae TaxID=2704140 RepID=UPI0037574E2B
MKIIKILFFVLSAIIILLGFLYFGNSKPKINKPSVDFCHGIVLDEKLKPIKNVEVYDIKKHYIVATNINGYFKFQIDTKISPEPLIFNKIGYTTDTVSVVGIMPRTQNVFYRFMYKKPDTIIMKKLKFSLQN